MNRISRLTAAAVMSAGLSLTGVGPAIAHADGTSYQGGNCPGGMSCSTWCPGDRMIPGGSVISWDWNVCHDWYWGSAGVVDVGTNMLYPWHGTPHQAPPVPPLGPPPPPAPPQPLPADCPPWSPFFAPSRCGGL
ncbi:MAG: hypothetical protein P4L86_23895 [Mycobacterium sp.]|nr:hypothetical protein [Mycobacterium sp.]